MVNDAKLINASEIYYKDMFTSDINKETKVIKEKRNLIEISKLINTSEIIYEDMLNF